MFGSVQQFSFNFSFVYSPESTQRELSSEYQHDRVKMFFNNLCVLVLWTKVALALKGLMQQVCPIVTLSPLCVTEASKHVTGQIQLP